MKKRFKTHYKRKYNIIRAILYILVIYLGYKFSLTFNRENLLQNGLNIRKINLSFIDPVSMISTNKEKLETTGNIVKDTEFKPLVYLYSTHDTEKYDSSSIEIYNLSYTVKTASNILASYLEKLDIEVLVETGNMSKYLQDNNMNYNMSYRASKYYASKALEKYPSIKYMFDIHRDGGEKYITTYEEDGTSYAKIMFVLGKDNENYETNLTMAEYLNNKLLQGMRRGIQKNGGATYMGTYNQNMTDNAVLIEVGGENNKIEEVDNSLKILSKAIYDYIMENKYE